MSDTAGLLVDGLTVSLAGSGVEIVSDVAFRVPPNHTLGIVGESGCGKTTVAMALLGFARPGTQIAHGRVVVDGSDILGLSAAELGRARGRIVSYVPQNPTRALSPGMQVGRQVEETVGSDPDRKALVRAAWEGAQLPHTEEMLGRYPHQLSGGQQQRVSIAMALVGQPRVIVMDEPTTGLDVLTQSRLLDVIAGLREGRSVSIVYVSHDLGVVRNLVDTVAVMYAGRVVESGPVDAVFGDPRHPYTRRLLEAVPRARQDNHRLRGIPGTAVEPWDRPQGCSFAPRCDVRYSRCDELPLLESLPNDPDRLVRCWRSTERFGADAVASAAQATPPAAPTDTLLLDVINLSAGYRGKRTGVWGERETTTALRAASFGLALGACLAVVGESGSGKSTLGRCLAGLHRPSAGEIRFTGQTLAALARDRPPDVRRRIQLVFQDPESSLTPHMSIRTIIRRPLRQFFSLSRAEEAARVTELLEQVHLPSTVADRAPRELSGGQKQRVAIARALAAQPELLICDEITSALDVAVQASILELLAELRRSTSLAILFVSHDLAVVRSISDEVLVLQSGEIVELAPRRTLFDHPDAPYTRQLLDAVPDLKVGDYPSGDAAPIARGARKPSHIDPRPLEDP